MTNTNSALDKQNPSHELARTASNEVGFAWLAIGGAYTGDSADTNANEADDCRDEGHMYPDDGDYDPSSDD